MNFQQTRFMDEIGNVRGRRGGGGERSRGEYKRREKGTCACYLLSYPMCVLARPLLYGHQGGRNGAPRVFQAA